MKYLLLISLVFISFNSQAGITPKVIGIKCINNLTLLSIHEGNFLNDLNLEIPTATTPWIKLKNKIKVIYKNDKRFLKSYLKEIQLIKSIIENSQASILTEVQKEELLFAEQPNCEYNTIFELVNDQIKVSKLFNTMTSSQKSAALYELLELRKTKSYKPIGFRKFIFSKFILNQSQPSIEDLIHLRKEAGYDSFEITNGFIDLTKKVEFRGEKLYYAFFKEGTKFSIPGGECLASNKTPTLFSDEKIVRVFTSENCLIRVNRNSYLTKKDTFIDIAFAGHIDSLYLKPGQEISNEYVQLTASSLQDKPSRVIFSIGGSGHVVQYRQFIGKAWVFNSFRTFVPYTNLGMLSRGASVDRLTLEAPFMYKINSLKVSLGGYTILNQAGSLSQAQVINKDTFIPVQEQIIKLKLASLIHFDELGNIKSFILGDRAILLNLYGEESLYGNGQQIYLDSQGRVSRAN